MAKSVVIVESPTKAKTINKFLGKGYWVKSCMGHIRDLPQYRLGVDVANKFTPRYEIPKTKRGVVKDLRTAVKSADRVYIATDEDREGEAIGWHLTQVTKAKPEKVRRIYFHEITREAIEEAMRNPRQIDMSLVNAQQARRILDRLVGYKISPLLGKKVRRGLSAGRVQSVALRLIAEREREINGFSSQEYWTIGAELTAKDGQSLLASLIGWEARRYEKSKTLHLFGEDYRIRVTSIQDEGQAAQIMSELKHAQYQVSKVKRAARKRSPSPPFMTSTLQQEASRKLSLSAGDTMRVAQELYEGIQVGEEGSVGLITYMRTDSLHVARSAGREAAQFIAAQFGKEYLPPQPRTYRTRAKLAQEAHEAIRPTSVFRTPDKIAQFLSALQLKLYSLIWRRFLSSQMADAIFDTSSVDIQAKDYRLRASGQSLKFDGFMKVYVESRGQEDFELSLPAVVEGETLSLVRLLPKQHFTQPPPRYNVASLIRTLERHGIGRPSTYAPTVSTILRRGYIVLRNKRFYPEPIGVVVTDLLVKHFPDIIDLGFTAQMEKNLDEVALGRREWAPVLEEFYQSFAKTLELAAVQMKTIKPPPKPTDQICELCGHPMVIREGRYGRFLACSHFPKCRNTRPLLKKPVTSNQPSAGVTRYQ